MRGLGLTLDSPYAATGTLPLPTATTRRTAPDANVSLKACGWPGCLRVNVCGFARLDFVSPLKELARGKPSDVMYRYSKSAKNFGSTNVAFGFLMGLVSFDLGLTTVSSCFLIWLEAVRDHPVPTLPM